MAELDRNKFKIIGTNFEDAEVINRPNLTYFQDAWRRLKENKIAIFSLWLLIFIILFCLFGPYISPHDYTTQNYDMVNQPPSKLYWFGTDNLGRDVFGRLAKGGRVSLKIGFLGTFIEIVIGCIYGGICGFIGGLTDDIMMRIIEILNSVPYLIVVILLAILLGQGITSLLLALCITGWTGIARIVRGQVMQLKETEFVMAAQTLGSSTNRIILKHLLPNTVGIIIVYITFDIPGYIFTEAWLSFIGLGVKPPNTSWGAMCAYGQSVMDFYPHELIFPSVAICLTMLAFNLFGDGLRDAMDPKLRQ